MRRLESLAIWLDEAVRERLSWYYQVSSNLKPARYLICKRIPCEADLKSACEEELWAEHERLSQTFLYTYRTVREGELGLKDLSKPRCSFMDLKVELVKRILTHCTFCEWNCRVNRAAATKHGACWLESESRVGSFFHHFGEELPIRGTMGSGTIFFTSCNMRCVFCVHPETFVLTQRGPVRIAHLYAQAGFETECDGGYARFPKDVYTFSHQGLPVKVAKVFKHNHSCDLILIESLYAPPIMVTPEHQILACEGPDGMLVKVAAGQLSLGHWLAIPRPVLTEGADTLDVTAVIAPLAAKSVYSTTAQRRLPMIEQAIALSHAGAKSHQIADKLDYHPTYVRSLLVRVRRGGLPKSHRQNSLVVESGRVRLKTEKRPAIPTLLKIDGELAEFLGYYCSEGHITKDAKRPSSYRTVLSFGRHEKNLVNRAVELIRRLFQVEPRVAERRTTITVELGKSSLALLLRALCGEDAATKRVPEFLFQAPPHVAGAYLRAFSAGDGSVTEGYLSVDTVSEQLAMGLFGLYLRLGHLPSFNVHEPRREKVIEGRRVKQSTLYYVKVRLSHMEDGSWQKARHVRYRFHGDHILVPIYRISRTPYSGPVYNLEVEDASHTYTANFIAIGNCQNGDISHDRFNGVPLSPFNLAYIMRQLRLEGCHNINLVGGEPTIHLHNIMEAINLLDARLPALPKAEDLERILTARADIWQRADPARAFHEGELNVPLLWNSNFFMSLGTMKLLRDVVDIWLPDFKFGNEKCAFKLSKTPWYLGIVKRNHKMVYEWGEDMVIRHLIMPNHVECCTKPVLEWVAQNTPKALVNIMDQYHPEYLAASCSMYADISGPPARGEIERAYRYAKELGLYFEPLSYEKSVYGIRI